MQRLGGGVVKNLKYSIKLTFPGYTSLIVPTTDGAMFNKLKSLPLNTQVILKCIVYRFFYFDGICNFFYVDKISVNSN